MSWRETVLLAGMLTALIPVLAAYVRHRSGLVPGLVLFAAAATVTFLGTLGVLLHAGAHPGRESWARFLIGLGVPVLVSGYYFSAVLGRQDPQAVLRSRRRTWIALIGFGVLFLPFLTRSEFLAGYWWRGESGYLDLGPVGKAYLSYLLVGIVLIGYNLESTYRLASAFAREALRPVVVGMFGALGFFTWVCTTGLLYASISLDVLVASVAPVGVAAVLCGYGFLRGTLSDAAVPVSRNLVYTSFTAFAAALYVLAVGLAAQVASFTRWSPGQVITVAFVFLILLGGLVFGFSHRVQRRVRRFVDRNFYVNRHDYRTQWFRAVRSLDSAGGMERLLRSAASLLEDVFRADRVTLAVRDRAGREIRVRWGTGLDVPDVELVTDSPLARKLVEERRSILLERRTDDFEYLPIYVENREWIDATASGAVAPLLAGDELLGTVGLARDHPEDAYSFEDLALLDCLSAHLAAVMRSVELRRELGDARETELLSQWSSMILHDFKNYLSPLRLIAENMRTHAEDPDYLAAAVEDLEGVVSRMERLVRRLGELREQHRRADRTVDLVGLVESAATELGLDRIPGLTVERRFQTDREVVGDPSLLSRVVENLITNAIDAMKGEGILELATEWQARTPGEVRLAVQDTGPGMDEEFLQKKLFRPFTSTKRDGLGLGLYQCRLIVEAHGGRLQVDSAPGRGCRVTVALKAVERRKDPHRGITVAGERPA